MFQGRKKRAMLFVILLFAGGLERPFQGLFFEWLRMRLFFAPQKKFNIVLRAMIMKFADPTLDKELERTQEQLERKIAELRLHVYPVKYQARYEIIFNPQDGGYDTVPVAKAQYTDPDTGVGFGVVYHPAEEAGRRTYFRVDIPCVVPEKLADEYCRICGVGNLRGLDDTDVELLSEPNYLVTDKEASITECFFYDEDVFLRSFRGWNAVIRILKHGKPRRLGYDVFGSD